MKRNLPTSHKNFRRSLSLLLCCLVLAACLGLPASSASGENAPGQGAGLFIDREPEPDSVPPTEIVPGADLDEPEEPDEEGPGEPGESEPGEPGENEPADPEESPSPAPEAFTVTFAFQENNTYTVTVAKGESVKPQEMPEISLEESTPRGYILEGWLDREGNLVDPTEVFILEDTLFTAQWRPLEIGELLDTENHKAYANGYTNGLFRPDGKVTRAEAATLIYNLLLDQSAPEQAFTDVKPDAWCAPAISKMYQMGIATGFEDGSFKPNRNITKAEFVKMAASLVPLEKGPCLIKDLKDGAWYTDYVVSAYVKDWVSGDENGNFWPEKHVTRAEAVTILNNVLGRSPAADIKSKDKVTNFYDVFPEDWAYGEIVEATTTHMHRRSENGGETWTAYTADKRPVKTGWFKDSGKTYYVGKDGKFLRGEQTLDGMPYVFDNKGALASGFFKKDGWTRYFKNGVMQEDISEMGVVNGPYLIKVYKPANYLIIFAKDADGKYTIPVRAMLTSCGEPTPTGTFYVPAHYRWLEMVGGSWAQWCTQILDSYLFHSVPNDLQNNYTMWASEYNNLGTTRSLGCIRLNCRDAKWIYDNCAVGTQIDISSWETSGPLARPEGLKIPGWHTWDPTDPTAYWMCQERGCH